MCIYTHIHMKFDQLKDILKIGQHNGKTWVIDSDRLDSRGGSMFFFFLLDKH